MTTIGSSDVLFAGWNNPVVSWYRMGMPAFYSGCDYVALAGNPPPVLRTALKRGGLTDPKWENYKIVIVQQPYGNWWLNHLRALQEECGTIVLYEIDDYLRGIAKTKGHQGQKLYTTERIKQHELLMGLCDGLIVSTPWLADAYRKFNDNIYVCKNCIEWTRYSKLTKPERPVINIGWAGGVGHDTAVLPWVESVARIMRDHKNTRFISIGQAYASALQKEFGSRAVMLPQTAIENFPSALLNFDIGIAPAGPSTFFRGKSDLRWLECGALGIPMVADPTVYDDIEPGETGFWAEGPEEAEHYMRMLVEDPAMGAVVGGQAQDYIKEKRSIEVGREQWETAFVTEWNKQNG